MSKEFSVCVIASGSKGNATLIKAGDTAFLVDAGISCRRITAGLKELDLDPLDLSGVLITHEHRDHVAGLPVLTRKYKLPVFANEETWGAMEVRNDIERVCHRLLPQNFSLGQVEISSFAISHDAAQPVGYSFVCRGEKCSYLTDSGFVNESIRQGTAGCDILILEANHDEDMLKNGDYPRMLKNRILSARGHLSNTAAGWFLANLDKMPKEVFLAHLSAENNRPELASETIKRIISDAGCAREPKLFIASQEHITHNISKE
ncbi:MAG TPA: MBL fold metallo-hydrolase [Candidatus Avacidaminococcus intestinavium]|uniref:MBL fold metallo-hydrolase n=1 Tax=Candidatus Avacidaminococcus intestinavium TaxID=2840684 RepID=A0A9D1MPB1_9FIRM|nr:MBL fold metallo-hydrolase [Candidatus Avacidaminococcus intestinavium]